MLYLACEDGATLPTIFTSKIGELPPTYDPKMIATFCLLVPFTLALIQTEIKYRGG